MPIDFVCRVGYALGFIWIFLFGGTAKEQLWKKFPRSFGKACDALEGLRMAERWNTAAHASSTANTTAV